MIEEPLRGEAQVDRVEIRVVQGSLWLKPFSLGILHVFLIGDNQMCFYAGQTCGTLRS